MATRFYEGCPMEQGVDEGRNVDYVNDPVDEGIMWEKVGKVDGMSW